MAMMTMASVQDEIARHKRKLCDLYFQRNSFIPICRLPTETLQTIFICLARDSYDQSCGTVTMVVPRWVGVSYVCRRWRDVALNCSTLWSCPFILSPCWTEELLSRSKRASLHIKVDFLSRLAIRRPRREYSFLRQLTDHAERIEELRLCHLYCTYDDIASLTSLRAPRLTNLSVSVDHRSVFNFPSVLFNGDTPILRTLNLSCYPISWSSLKAPGLTTLRLGGVRTSGQFQHNLVDFLAALERMRNLTYLELDDAFSSSSVAFKDLQEIVLPHLSRLRINAPISTIITLLHCLGIPLKTIVRLECTSEPLLFLDDYAPLSSLLVRRSDTSGIQSPSSSIVRSLHVRFGGISATLTLNALERGCQVTTSPTDEMWDRDVPSKITVRFDGDHDVASFVSDICRSIPPTDVQNLYVWEPPSSSAFWKKTLTHLQGIWYLKLERGNMPDLISLLSPSHGGDVGGDTGRGLDGVCIPALKRLELHDLDFASFESASYGIEGIQSLCDALSCRTESKGVLVIDRCRVMKGRLVELKMVGRWKYGRFRVVERYTRLSSEGSEYSESEESPWIWSQLVSHTKRRTR